MDLVVRHVDARVEHQNAIAVVKYVVVLYPAEPSFDAEDTLAPPFENQIVEYDGVCRILPSVGYVCFVILEQLVLFYVPAG